MKNNKKHTIRIISGKFKGSKILIKKKCKIRPTTDCMRETLFSWINKEIINANCLDCFSGSGALGIEATSRYAASVTFIEKDTKTIHELKKTMMKFKKINIKIIHANTNEWLKKIRKSYDIIFLDPPFKTELLQKTIFQLETYKYVKIRSLIYIEREKTSKQLFIPNTWTLYKEKKTSKTHCQLYIREKNI
ncbi:MAG: 16S rRNA (guanine(966)-N(2))-methyltransferase RsmD [Buchnera aphidicola (Schlechtendalia peitan)]